MTWANRPLNLSSPHTHNSDLIWSSLQLCGSGKEGHVFRNLFFFCLDSGSVLDDHNWKPRILNILVAWFKFWGSPLALGSGWSQHRALKESDLPAGSTHRFIDWLHRSYYTGLAGLEPTVYLPQPPKCWPVAMHTKSGFLLFFHSLSSPPLPLPLLRLSHPLFSSSFFFLSLPLLFTLPVLLPPSLYLLFLIVFLFLVLLHFVFL